MRHGRHYIRQNESIRFPASCLTVDTETIPYEVPNQPGRKLHRLRLWCAKHWIFEKGQVTRAKWKCGYRTESFWEFLLSCTSPYKPLHVFAHNLGFDLTILRFWRELEARRLTRRKPGGWRGLEDAPGDEDERCGILCLNDPPTIVEVWKAGTRNRIVFLDTLNYWRCSLEELGDEFGLVKGCMPPFEWSDEEWLRYCTRDVEILAAAVEGLKKFIETNDAGVFKYTIGAQAMASFQHAHMKHKILPHREEYPLALEREAYRGGEVRLGFAGHVAPIPRALYPTAVEEVDTHGPWREGPVWVYDCQAFYPSVMRDNEFPTMLLGSAVEPTIASALGTIEDRFCVAEVGLETWEHSYPVKANGVSVCAVGRFRTVLCAEELRRAARRGHITWVGRINWYKSAPLFRTYVEYWWERRLAARAAGRVEEEFLIKSIMNALPGKFGQRRERWREGKGMFPIRPWGTYWDWCPETGEYEYCRAIVDKVQVNLIGGEASNSFPAIAAAVTSYGRCRMEDLRAAAGAPSFLYQDTDSLHVLRQGVVNLARAGEIKQGIMGKLTFKGCYPTAEYRGVKDYTVGGQRVIAGIKHSAEQLEVDTFRQIEFQKLASILSSAPHDGVFVTEREIHLHHSLPPCRWLSDGSVLPIVLPIESSENDS